MATGLRRFLVDAYRAQQEHFALSIACREVFGDDETHIL